MSTQFSRRSLLKGAVLGGATLPFVQLHSVLEKWHRDESGIIPSQSGSPVVRLSHNENPYGPSEAARNALIAAISKGNRYARESILTLKTKIAEHENLSADQILISAGSSELLGVAGLMAGMHKGKLIACHPTFPFLMEYASRLAAQWVKVPLTEDHHYNLAGINTQLDNNTAMIFLCNPNNPTGTELPRTMLEPFTAEVSKRCTVFVDEAYIELSSNGLASSLASMTATNPNIIISRTFSKIYGMAGLRIGYAIAHPDTVAKLGNLMTGANISTAVTSVEAAVACIGDKKFMDYCKDMNAQAREMIYTKFKTWGIEYIPSSTNFIFFKTDRFGTTDVYQALQQKNVMIRAYADVPGWARVSMGTHDEIKVFLDNTEELLV